MFLKSERRASSLSDPNSSYTLARYCAKQGLPYAETGKPVSLEIFTRYAFWFQRLFAPNVEDELVTNVEKSPNGCNLHLSDGSMLLASRLPKGVLSVRIVKSPKTLLALYKHAEVTGTNDLFLQEYISDSSAEDWIFHGYAHPESGYLVAFTGRKLRSSPQFASSTTLGVSQRSDELVQQTERFLRAVRYAGIMDLDYRLDKLAGRYKFLDFNPRIGANFRMFADRDELDVIRDQHLDLTGRTVYLTRGVQVRTFVVEPYDVLANLGYFRRNHLTLRERWLFLARRKESAWFSADDPVTFLAMCVRLLLRGVVLLIGKKGARSCLIRPTAETGSTDAERRPTRTLGACK